MPNDTILKGPVPLTPIPEGANPYRAIVNGVEHDYEAGSSAAVAPGVKELINAADNFPPAAEEVKPPFAGGGGGGGSSGSLVVNITYDDQEKAVLDQTWQEIYDAAHAGSPIVVKEDYKADGIFYYLLTDVSQSGSTYLITLHNPATITKAMVLQTDLASGYPHS